MSDGNIDGNVGVVYVGFVAEQDGQIVASDATLGGLVQKAVVKELLGKEYLIISQVTPPGGARICAAAPLSGAEMRYSFGAYSGDDLKALAEKYLQSVQNVSFGKTQDLIDLCLAIIGLFIIQGGKLDLRKFMAINEIVDFINKKQNV